MEGFHHCTLYILSTVLHTVVWFLSNRGLKRSRGKVRIPEKKIEKASEGLLYNANSAICQLYHGKNKLILNKMMIRSALYQTNMLSWIFSASSLKQQCTYRDVAPLGHIILIPRRVFALFP